jgi:hypothetical protein
MNSKENSCKQEDKLSSKTSWVAVTNDRRLGGLGSMDK